MSSDVTTDNKHTSVTTDNKHTEVKKSFKGPGPLAVTQFDCSLVSDYSELCTCLEEKVVNDYYQLLNLVQRVPKSECCNTNHHHNKKQYNCGWTKEENECYKQDTSYNSDTVACLLEEASKANPNVPIRLCKLSNSLLSFLGCNSDDYLFWRLVILYGRKLKCNKDKMVCNPFCVPEPCVDYRALCKVSTILSAVQQDPDTNITYDTVLEMVTLLMKTVCSDLWPQINTIMLLIQIAVTGCKAQNIDGSNCAPNSQFFSNTAPTGDPVVANGPQNFPCGGCIGQPFSLYVAQEFKLADVNTLNLFTKLKVFGFLMFLAFEYLCDFTMLNCLCIEQITLSQTTPGYVMCGTDPETDTPNLSQYTPAPCPPPPTCTPPCIPPVPAPCPDPPVCAVPELATGQFMYGVNPLGDCLITLLKRLYCTFTQSVCDSPCPSTLFEYLLKYSPEYSNDTQRLLKYKKEHC